jgi:hypothetical protein
MKSFDDWFYEYELFSSRSERLAAMLHGAELTIVKLWLQAAYNQGREDEREDSKDPVREHSKHYYDLDRNR